MQITMKKISVVIPAINEEKIIKEAIERLRKQDMPREEFEIIVSDNGSTDRTSEEARKAGADKVVFQPNRGTNFVRQKGFESAEADIIAFLDADNAPPNDWLTKAYARLKNNPRIGLLSGPYEYADAGPLFRIISLIYQSVIIPIGAAVIGALFFEKGALALGGNMIIRRKALEDIGGFDTAITFWGDDADTAIRITRSGVKAVYDPFFTVRSSTRRFNKRGLFATIFGYMKAYVKAYKRKEMKISV